MLTVTKIVEGDFQTYNLAAKAAGYGKKGGLKTGINRDLTSGRITAEEAAEMSPQQKEPVLPGSSIWRIEYKGKSIELDFNPLDKQGSVKSDTRVKLWMEAIDKEEAAAAAALEAAAAAEKDKVAFQTELDKYNAWKAVWTLSFQTQNVSLGGEDYKGIKELSLILWDFFPFSEWNEPLMPNGSLASDPDAWKNAWENWLEELVKEFPSGNIPDGCNADWW